MAGLRLLAHLQQQLANDFGLSAVVACEIEFYLRGSFDNPAMPLWREDVQAACAVAGISVFNIEAERGYEQHEIALSHIPDALRAAQNCEKLIQIITDCAEQRGMVADFLAKPQVAQPGSGLHVHVHLADSEGNNIFTKRDDDMSDGLRHSLGGLLAWLPDSMAVFAPHVASYARFVSNNNAPTTISWGANNRTVALRLPDKARSDKHIEHRVAGSDADPMLVVAVILAAIHDGLTRKLEPSVPQIYGDASLAQYGLDKLPATLIDALQQMQQSQAVARYFSVEDLFSA